MRNRAQYTRLCMYVVVAVCILLGLAAFFKSSDLILNHETKYVMPYLKPPTSSPRKPNAPINKYYSQEGQEPDTNYFLPYLKPPTSSPRRPATTIKYYSQEGQEKVVYDIFPIDNGFFIEMGALDGKSLSNTLWLEEQHKWTGLLIEANPDLCKEIDKLHRNVWRLCACISDKKDSIFIQMSSGDTALGGLQDTYIGHVDQNKMLSRITVPCIQLQPILNYIKQKRINYFSLDVEGGEMVVLETLRDSLKTRDIIVDVWTIEYAVHHGNVKEHTKNLQKLRNFFSDVGGYVEHSHLGISNTAGNALDVVFVNSQTWCSSHNELPGGQKCPV